MSYAYGYGYGYGLKRPSVGLRSDTAAFIARMSVAPDTVHRNALDKFFGSTAAMRQKTDCLYLLAAHDAQAARLNLVSSSFSLAEVNAPVFAADRGYQGDGATSYLESSFNPVTAGGGFSLNDASMGIWSRTNVNNSAFIEIGNSNALLQGGGGGAIFMNSRLNNGASSGSTQIPDSVGHICISRQNANDYARYKSGSLVGTLTQASTSMTSASFWVCGRNSGGFSGRELAAAHWGRGLSADEVATLNTALQTYLQTLGAA